MRSPAAAFALCLLAGVAPLGASERQFTREPNIDRSGNDIRRDVMPADASVDDCAAACSALAGCVAFTFVKKSTSVPQPICWLKDATPFGYESSCCTSGVLKR